MSRRATGVSTKKLPNGLTYSNRSAGGGEPEGVSSQYDLIGVTVHTGTADGGHYYSFIRDRTAAANNSWLFFNDAEVKPFDPSQLAGECFGGEMTVRLNQRGV